jgi:hypothetical protein
MTWYLDPETGEVYDPDGELVGTAPDGPPYTIPADIRTVVIRDRLPNPNAAASGQDVIDALSVRPGNVEFGSPP